MQPVWPLTTNLLVALILISVGMISLRRRSGRESAMFALLPLIDAVLLTVFVFGEDTYRDSGISRWDAYRSPEGALGPLFVVTLALLALSGALLAYSALRARGLLFAAAALGSGTTALLLVTATVIGFSAN